MASSPTYNWPEPDNSDLVKNGALAIRTLGDAIDTTMGTMVAKTIVDAKGDLIAGTAADTASRLAVGNNGETLVADSSTSTGLRWQGDYAAGKNKIINGDFGIWQRGTSFTGALNIIYTADRWQAAVSTSVSGLAWTVSQQTFTPGSAPVAGYEGTYFLRADISTIGSAVAPRIKQRIEDVRTFAGQTVTVSWWGRSSTSTTIAGALGVIQNFGSGGSTTVSVVSQTITYTSSWQRFTQTFNMPSVSGKTIGAGSYLEIRYLLEAANGSNLDIWGVQLEAGSVATAFQTATGTIQGELAACQRYYYRETGGATYSPYGLGYSTTTTTGYALIKLPQTMRVNPTAVEFSSLAFNTGVGTVIALSAVTLDVVAPSVATIAMTTTSTWTSGVTGRLLNNNNTAGFIGFTAEL